MRNLGLLTAVLVSAVLFVSGCQSAARTLPALPAPSPGGLARLTIGNGAYLVQVESGPAHGAPAVAASANFAPAAYSIISAPTGSYQLHFLDPGKGGQRWTVRLSPAWRWALAVRGGTTHLHLDLAGLVLNSLDISGGAYTMVVELPSPRGRVPVDISGGANQITFELPRGSSAALQVGPGVSRVQGGIPVGSGQYTLGAGGGARNRYQIEVSSGVAAVVLTSA